MTNYISSDNKRREVFNDITLEEGFNKDGYIIVPFLSEEEVSSLKNDLIQFTPSDEFKGNQETLIGQQSFHVTFFDSNQNYKQKVYDYLTLKFKDISTRLLANYKCAQANVFLKPARSGFVYPHQNLTITDESKYTSVSFWLPLQHTDFENGTICLIPGSQRGFVKYRNTHVYWPYVNYFKDGPGIHYFKSINVKAGELLIIDDRIIHYTPINNSNEGRWVAHALWAPTEAPIWFCHPHKNEVDIYEVENTFWQFHAPGTMPNKDYRMATITSNEVVLTDTELEEALKVLKK